MKHICDRLNREKLKPGEYRSGDKDVVLQQIARLLRGEAPPPITHRIMHKAGSVRWFRNTSVPVFDPQGKLIAYDGLVVDISEIEFSSVEQEHQIVELTAALALVKTLQGLLPICCSCKKIRDDKDYWKQIESYLEGRYSSIAFTHGICPDCTKTLYPKYCVDNELEITAGPEGSGKSPRKFKPENQETKS